MTTKKDVHAVFNRLQSILPHLKLSEWNPGDGLRYQIETVTDRQGKPYEYGGVDTVSYVLCGSALAHAYISGALDSISEMQRGLRGTKNA